ncbi:signal peptidase I [Micrococcus sp. FDAARGOS_333]|uniref:signal peptidase I n=1 Tax=Micrococcus sp. FDAARGOS_333 TaxID=1930558 RepID=UPI000B4E151A|nr:signal peptidase I [Micrococcus sp. FDAARGOS_333]PNL17833.1 signal peptidase I [Micrococcus sp. FDAARGOS_333]
MSGSTTCKRVGPTLRQVLVIVAVVLLLTGLMRLFLVRIYHIPSESMEDTLQVGDRVAVSLLVPQVLDLRRGDVVVFRDTKGWLPAVPDDGPLTSVLRIAGLVPEPADENVVKRVVGLPGDHVCWEPGDAGLTVNGVEVTEPYLFAGDAPSVEPFDVVVPAGRLWVLGDHRSRSADSRAHQDGPGAGFVSVDDLVGRAEARVWPVSRWGSAGSDPDTFAGVPEASR